MKKFMQILIVLVALGLVLGASAQTLLSTVASDVRDATVVEDQSKIPDQANRFGYAIAKYDVAVQGGTGVVEFGPAIPDNTAIVGGYVYVTTAVLPATATQAVHLVAANDLLTAGTSLQSTGLKRLGAAADLASITVQTRTLTNVVAGVTNTYVMVTNVVSTAGLDSTLPTAPVESTSEDQIDLTWTGSTATQGVFFVVLDLIKVQ